MNRYWRVTIENPAGNDFANKTYELWRILYGSQSEAEKEAERLARANPGLRYGVYEVTSIYIVDGLTRELPEDLKAVAQEQIREHEQAQHERTIPPICGDSIYIAPHTHTCNRVPGHEMPHRDGKKSWEPKDKPQTRLAPGTRVRTVKPPSESKDWTPDSRLVRRWGVTGTVVDHHDSHGLYYEVLHDDDQRKAPYEPHELTVISPGTP